MKFDKISCEILTNSSENHVFRFFYLPVVTKFRLFWKRFPLNWIFNLVHKILYGASGSVHTMQQSPPPSAPPTTRPRRGASGRWWVCCPACDVLPNEGLLITHCISHQPPTPRGSSSNIRGCQGPSHHSSAKNMGSPEGRRRDFIAFPCSTQKEAMQRILQRCGISWSFLSLHRFGHLGPRRLTPITKHVFSKAHHAVWRPRCPDATRWDALAALAVATVAANTHVLHTKNLFLLPNSI